MELRSKTVLAMGSSFAIPITIAGLIYAIAKTPVSQFLFGHSLSNHSEGATVCQTLTADPKPPLNVRSSPVAAIDNTVGRIPNGILLAVVDESEGWLKINHPIPGWVYRELTVTSCVNPRDAASRTMLMPQQKDNFDRGPSLMAIATQQYHSGNLNGAIALAKAVSADSLAYPTAKLAIAQWPQAWNRAEARYYSAQKALRDGRWHDALMSAREFPDVRFWKEKLTPIVKQAIEQSQPTNAASGAQQQR